MPKGKKKASAKRATLRASRREIGTLQEWLARSVLTGEPLPGGTDPVSFPDSAFFQRQPVVVLDAANFAGKMEAVGVSKPIRVESRDRIHADAREQGDLTYLHFEPAEVEDNEVRLTVQGKIAPGDPQRGVGNLSNIHVRFRKRGDTWELVGGPSYSAA